MCLVLWLAAAVLAGFLWPYRIYSYRNEACYNDPENMYGGFSGVNCVDPFKGRGDELLGAAVLASILWLVEFALFIGACVDTAKRNSAKGGRVVVIGAPPYWPAGPSAQGYESMGNSYYAPQMAMQQQQQMQQMQQSPQMQMQTQPMQDGQYMGVPLGMPLQTRSPSPSPRASESKYRSVPRGNALQTPSTSAEASESMASLPPPQQHGEQVGGSWRSAADMATPGSQVMEYYKPAVSR